MSKKKKLLKKLIKHSKKVLCYEKQLHKYEPQRPNFLIGGTFNHITGRWEGGKYDPLHKGDILTSVNIKNAYKEGVGYIIKEGEPVSPYIVSFNIQDPSPETIAFFETLQNPINNYLK